MELFTVCFFGHRSIIYEKALEDELFALVCETINSFPYVDFLVGRDGDFDQFAASAVRSAKKKLSDANSSLIWVQPYLKAEYKHNPKDYESYYDVIEICEASAGVHPKAAIQIRNRSMVDRSDLCVFYVSRPSGGAWQTMQYAKKQKKTIVNLCDIQFEEQN